MSFRKTLLIVLGLALGVLFLALALQFWQTSATKIFSLDEFFFADASWQLARGREPYRDFVIHYTPLSFFVFSIPWHFLDDNPANIVVLRQLILITGAITVLFVWYLTDRSWWGMIGGVLLLATSPFVHHGVEIRRDNLTLPLLLLIVVIVQAVGIHPRVRGVLIGTLYGLLLWSNEKAVTFAAPLLAMVLAGLFHRDSIKRNLTGSPLAFFGGFAAVSGAVILYFALTQNLAAWFEWCVVYPIKHEAVYPGLKWDHHLIPFAFKCWWLILLGLLGAAATLGRYRAGVLPPEEVLLLLLLPATLFSFVLLGGPWPYSLLPFHVILSIFAGRGIITVCTFIGERAASSLEMAFAAVTGALLVVPFSLHVEHTARQLVEKDNSYQLAILETIGKLTSPNDAVFDSSGSSVSRPSVSRFFYTDSSMRLLMPAQIEMEMMGGLNAKNTVMFFHDLRIGNLPIAVQKYLFQNFLPYNGEIGIRGRRYTVTNGELNSEFLTPVPGKYFVDNESAPGGSLKIDGSAITERIFTLEPGSHSVVYSGPIDEFSIVWLPRDGIPFMPLREFAPKFSVLY